MLLNGGYLLGPGRSESAFAPLRIGERCLDPLDRFVLCQDHLRDAVSGVNGIRFPAQIQQNYANFAPVSWVDGARRVGHGDGMLQGETAARTHLRFISRWNLQREAGGHQARNSGLQQRVLHGVQIHAGIFGWTVGVGGQDGGGMDTLDLAAEVPDTAGIED